MFFVVYFFLGVGGIGSEAQSVVGVHLLNQCILEPSARMRSEGYCLSVTNIYSLFTSHHKQYQVFSFGYWSKYM